MNSNGMPGEIDESMFASSNPDMERLSLAYRASLSTRSGMNDMNDIKQLKQKNKILKEAVLKEREQKVDLFKKLEQMSTSYSESIKLLEKKEDQTISQEKALQQLRDSLLIERNNSSKYMDLYQKAKTQLLINSDNGVSDTSSSSSPSDSFFSGFSSILGLSGNGSSNSSSQNSAGLAKLQAANTELQEELKKKNMALVNAEEKARNAFSILAKELELYKETSSKQIIGLEESLNAKIKSITELELSLAAESAASKQQKEALANFKEEIEVLTLKVQSVTSSLSKALEQKETISQELSELKNSNNQLQKENEQLSQNLSSTQERIVMFTLRRHTGLQYEACQVSQSSDDNEKNTKRYLICSRTFLIPFLSPPQIVCRKDLEGQHIMDFDTLKERFSMNVNDVRDVICEYDPEPVLTLNLNKSNTLVFKGNMADVRAAEKKFRQFVMDAPSSKAASRSINASQKDQKGLVDNLYSFFK